MSYYCSNVIIKRARCAGVGESSPVPISVVVRNLVTVPFPQSVHWQNSVKLYVHLYPGQLVEKGQCVYKR